MAPGNVGVTEVPPPNQEQPASPDRLDSWKEIAAYLRRSVRTVRRWESEEGLPVHRHLHQNAGSVYAFKTELDVWRRGRASQPEATANVVHPWHRRRTFIAGGIIVIAALAFASWRLWPRQQPHAR